jgi:UDP-3-O-[3-hydroxymyristoyl] glucosamine N-acyltransferase
LLESYKIPNDRFVNFIHPLAYISPDNNIGKGNVILSNSSLEAGVKIGDNNIFNSNITIEHNSSIGNGNFFSANSCIGANVNIGNNCFFGLNSSVRENVTLSGNVFVGMHSLVLNDFGNVQVAGVPAKIKERKKSEDLL